MQNIIKYSGLKDLNDEEQGILKNLVEKDFSRIKMLVNKECDLIVAVKAMKKDTRKRYQISMRLETPGSVLYNKINKDTEKGGDWDLAKALHKELDGLYFEIKHDIEKNEDSQRKGRIRSLIKKFTS